MGINNRKRRKEKKRKKQLNQKQSTNKKRTKSPYPDFVLQNNPLANLSLEERKIVLDSMQKKSETLYKESLDKIISIFSENDPISLLSMLASYGLTVGVGEQGIDRRSQEEGLQQAHIEIAQAIMLTLSDRQTNIIIKPETYQSLQDSLIELNLAFAFQRHKVEFLELNEQELSITGVQEMVRSHTQTVRNWGHFSQVKRISKELYITFEHLLTKEYGFSVTEIIHFFDSLTQLVEEKVSQRFQNLKNVFSERGIDNIVKSYMRLIDQNDKQITEVVDIFKRDKTSKEEVMASILTHYDLRISENYIFNIDDISKVTGLELSKISLIIDKFSYSLGGLKDQPIEYIYFNNPIWTRPIIRLTDKLFFCPMPQLFFSFILNIFDGLIEKVDATSLSKRKTQFLEDSIEKIVKQRFPESNTVKNIKWKDGPTEYETDLITAIDSYIIIIEAKSGKIDPSSLRGAPKRLERDIKKLLIEPNVQSKRLKDKLLYLINNPDVEDELRQKLPFNLSQSSKVLRVSVTLEYFASLQSNMKHMEKTDWISDEFEYCPTMNIADFETVFDILEHPIEIINYLEKREQLEGTIDYFGDELDLLGYYLTYHLNIPATSETGEKQNFAITTMSYIIDDYYDSLDAGIKVEKPIMKMNALFKSIIEQLETRKTKGWTEIGAILCSFLPKDQDKLASMVLRLKTNVKKHWRKEGHENTLVYIPPLNTSYALCYLAFNDQNKEDRYNFAENAAANALEKEHVNICLVIGKNIDSSNSYDLIALFK